jgi:hypothetical protein
MPVASSGAIDLDEFHVEAGGSTGSSCSINDADIRALIDKSDGATMAFNEWYGATASLDQDSGSVTAFGATSSNLKHTTATFDSNSNKVVIVYRLSNKGYAVVGTPAEDLSITFGTPVQFDSTSLQYGGFFDVTFDSNSNKVVVVYGLGNTSSYGGRAIVGTVSGTGISFGSPTNFASSGADNQINCVFDSNSNKVVVCWTNAGSSSAGTAIVGTVSGTNISFGSAATWGFASANIAPVFDSNSNKVVVFAEDTSGSDVVKAVVGTVSGTGISFGTPAQVSSSVINASSYRVGAVFDSNSNKCVYFYADASDSNKGKAVVGTVSGTDISFGNVSTFDSGATNYLSRLGSFDTNVNKVVYAYSVVAVVNSANVNRTRVVVGTVSGTGISFGTPADLDSYGAQYTSSTFDSNLNKVIVAFKGNGNEGRAVVFQNAT